MKRVLVLVAVAGCRIGFEEVATTDASADATSDAPLGPTCTATKIAGFQYSGAVTDIAAARVADGYAIGAIYSSSSFWGVHLDTQLVPSTPAPNQTTPIAGFDGSYTNGSMFFDGTNLDGSLSVGDGTMFVKTFATDMSGFVVAVQKTGQVGEPSIARAGTTLFSTWFHDNVVQFVTLLADGSPDATERVLAPNEPANIVSTSAASGGVAFVAWSLANGTCAIAAVTETLAVTTGTSIMACANPYAHADASSGVLAYESSGAIQIATIVPSPAPSLIVGVPVQVGTGSDPVVWFIGNNRWAAWRDASRLHMSAVSAIADVTILNAPSGPPDAYAAAGPYLFAVWGQELWAITCP